MRNTLSLKRIGMLLRYDWINFRKPIGILLLVVEMFFLVSFACKYWYSGWSEATPSEYLLNVTIHSYSFFSMVSLLMLILITKFLHRKVNHGNDSIPFVMLPASPQEKVLEIHLTYLIAWGGFLVLTFFNLFILTLKPLWNTLWVYQKLMPFVGDGFPIGINKTVILVWGILFMITLQAALYILYLNFNLLFSKNPQGKSILMLFASIGLLAWYYIKLGIEGYLNPVGVNENLIQWEAWIGLVLFMLPVAGLFWCFYYQIKEKQIR